jgi:hypothetical protein
MHTGGRSAPRAAASPRPRSLLSPTTAAPVAQSPPTHRHRIPPAPTRRQLCIGVVLLGLFEGYKVLRIRYFNGLIQQAEQAAQEAAKAGKQLNPAYDPAVIAAQSAITVGSPMGVVWVRTGYGKRTV